MKLINLGEINPEEFFFVAQYVGDGLDTSEQKR
jgi:hypothetical protein